MCGGVLNKYFCWEVVTARVMDTPGSFLSKKQVEICFKEPLLSGVSQRPVSGLVPYLLDQQGLGFKTSSYKALVDRWVN